MEQLASKTSETDSFSFKLPFHDVSTSMSEILTYSHQIPSCYIKLHHEFDHEREKRQTEKKLGEKIEFLAKKVNFPSCVPRLCPCTSRLFLVDFGGLPVHQFAPSGNFGKVYQSTF